MNYANNTCDPIKLNIFCPPSSSYDKLSKTCKCNDNNMIYDSTLF